MTVEPGRCGEALSLGPALAAGDEFPFVCAGCGGCCRKRRDLVLSGYDLYRIARRLYLPPRVVAQAFCKSYIAPQSCLPALRLTPSPETGDCRFLEGGACVIHEARPLACALYPLGQCIDPDTGAVAYHAQLPLCGLRREGRTLRQYLADAALDDPAGCGMRAGRPTRIFPPPYTVSPAPSTGTIPWAMNFTPSSSGTWRSCSRCWSASCNKRHPACFYTGGMPFVYVFCPGR